MRDEREGGVAEDADPRYDELRRLREIAKINSYYRSELRRFRRNESLSDVAHASFHVLHSVLTLVILVFHFSYHDVNEKRRKEDPSVPEVPHKWSSIFCTVYPLCMAMSATLAISRSVRKLPTPSYEVMLGASAIGSLLTIFGGIEAMAVAEKHIDIEVVADEALKVHPIFIHSVAVCILSLFAACMYLAHAWIVYDCLWWNLENEPVVLYCCCVDLYSYLKMKHFVPSPTHEFQVVHVM